MNGQPPWEPVVAVEKSPLLARISNWLHGKTGESVLDLANAVDDALANPVQPDSVALPSLIGRALVALQVHATALDALTIHRHEQNGHLGRVETCGETECQEHVEIRTSTLALINQMEVAPPIETLLRDQLADARAEGEAWQKDNVKLSRINADDAETIRVLRAELQGVRRARAAIERSSSPRRDRDELAKVSIEREKKCMEQGQELVTLRLQLDQRDEAARALRADVDGLRSKLIGVSDVLRYITGALNSAKSAQVTEIEDIIKRTAIAAELARK